MASVTDDGLEKRLGRNARRDAVQGFDVQAHVQRYLDWHLEIPTPDMATGCAEVPPCTLSQDGVR